MNMSKIHDNKKRQNKSTRTVKFDEDPPCFMLRLHLDMRSQVYCVDILGQVPGRYIRNVYAYDFAY